MHAVTLDDLVAHKKEEATIERNMEDLSATSPKATATNAVGHPEDKMKRTPIRVEPISTRLERRRKGPIYPVIVAGETVYVSGLPPFDPESGEVERAPFARQSERVLEQMRHCLEAARSSLDRVLKCNVYCTPDERHFELPPIPLQSEVGLLREPASEKDAPNGNYRE